MVSAVFSGLLLSCAEGGKKNEVSEAPGQHSLKSKNSDSFNQSFEKLLTAYYSLKDAMVEYDTVHANAASRQIANYADSLLTQQSTQDSSRLWVSAKNYAGTITGSALALVAEPEILSKKKEFQMISDAMYDLVQTVNYDRQLIYRQHCPMAFNDAEEAHWLSNSRMVVNPYFGKKHPKYKSGMLHCGDVTDSLNYN